MKQNNSIIKFLVLVTFITLSLFAVFSSAAQATTTTAGASLEDPLGGRELPQIIGEAIEVGLGIVGAIALALFVYGGFVMMTAGGNATRVGKGREVLIWATIGLAVIFTSYAILSFVIKALTGS